jgi:hypothetical protein
VRAKSRESTESQYGAREFSKICNDFRRPAREILIHIRPLQRRNNCCYLFESLAESLICDSPAYDSVNAVFRLPAGLLRDAWLTYMPMINEILAILRDRLENVLQASQSQAEPWVLLGSPGGRDGDDSREITNKVVMSVIGLQSDASAGLFAAPNIAADDRYYSSPPPLHLDAFVMVAANFAGSNYETGLSRLSSAIYFFQSTPVLTRNNTPQLPDDMDKLAIEFVSLDFAQMAHLLTALGMKYMPFVVYRLRRLPFDARAAAGGAPAVSATGPRGEIGANR